MSNGNAPFGFYSECYVWHQSVILSVIIGLKMAYNTRIGARIVAVEVNELVTNKLDYQIMENINENEELNQPSCLGAVISRAYSDADLQDRVNHWLDHYTRCGESHYADTKDWRILEIYWDRILDRVLNELEITDEEVEPMADRISALF
jgi:hypothetical protein